MLGKAVFDSKQAQQISSDQELITLSYDMAITNQGKHAHAFVYHTVLQNPQILSLIAQANNASEQERSNLRHQLYQRLKDDYAFRSKNYGFRQFHFHLKDNTSFLRFHKPERFGDDLTHVRSTVAYVNKYHLPVHSFEEGRVFNGYRFVYPLFLNNQHIGSVEASINMHELLEQVQQKLRLPAQFIINKEVVDTKVFPEYQSFYRPWQINSGYLIERNHTYNSSDELVYLLKKSNVNHSDFKKKLHQGKIFSLAKLIDHRYYITTFLPIMNDLQGKSVGYFIVSREHITFGNLIDFMITMLVMSNLVFLIILILFNKFFQARISLQQKNQLLESMEKQARIGTWHYQTKSNKLEWSHQIFKLLNLPFNIQPTLELFYQAIHPDDVDAVEQAMQQALQNKKDYSIHHRVINRDGSISYFIQNCHLRVQHNHVTDIFGVTQDVTELEMKNEQLNNYINSQKEITMLTDGNHTNFINAAGLAFFNSQSLEDFIETKTNIGELFINKENFFCIKNDTYLNWVEQLLSLKSEQRIVLMRNSEGNIRAFSIVISPFDNHQFVVSFHDVTRDITERRRLKEQMIHDELTQAYNRNFLKNLELELEQQLYLGRHYYLLMIDIDHFKDINDNYGHLTGDRILVDLSNLIIRSVRNSDYLIRWGGEEFLLIGETSQTIDVELFAEKLRKTVDQAKFNADINHITCSIGCTLLKKEEAFNRAIKRADDALYQAKNSGRNCVRIVFDTHPDQAEKSTESE